jgi:hypothetical protein
MEFMPVESAIIPRLPGGLPLPKSQPKKVASALLIEFSRGKGRDTDQYHRPDLILP